MVDAMKPRTSALVRMDVCGCSGEAAPTWLDDVHTQGRYKEVPVQRKCGQARSLYSVRSTRVLLCDAQTMEYLASLAYLGYDVHTWRLVAAGDESAHLLCAERCCADMGVVVGQ